MKLKHTHLAVLAAFTLAGSASAATVLLSDNFNESTPNTTAVTFNDNLGQTQGGTLATVGYTTVDDAQHSKDSTTMFLNGGTGPSGSNVYASLNHNFATDANTANQALEIKFNLSVASFYAGNWATIAIGASQNLFLNNAGNQFSSLFRHDGGSQQFSDGSGVGSSTNFTNGDLITLVLSDTAGTGSAFNGNGSVAKLYINNTLDQTFSGLGLGANDGYISFQASTSTGAYDNLVISTIPEPGAALLGGLGMLALLRRRR